MAGLRIVTLNLHWPNSQADYEYDINQVKDEADVICFQETYDAKIGKFLGPNWNTYDADGRGNTDNAMAWRKSRIRVVDKGHYWTGVLDNVRHKTFKIAWIKAVVDGKDTVIIGSCHPPHGGYTRYDSGLYGRIMDKTVEFWRKHDVPKIIGGDWNKPIAKDPGNLSSRLPAYWVRGGAKIDGFLISNKIDKTDTKTWGLRALRTDHPAVQVVIDPKSIKSGVSGAGRGGVKDSGEAGSPTTPAPEDNPPPRQAFQPDLGHDEDIEHDECCGGTQVP